MSDLRKRVNLEFNSGQLEKSRSLKYDVSGIDIPTFEILAKAPCKICQRNTKEKDRGYRNIGLYARSRGYIPVNV